MKKQIISILFFLLFCINATSQNVGINSDGSNPHASAMLDVKSTSQGFLPPRLTQAQRTSISSPATGLIVYQSDYSAGYYFYTGSEWIMLGETPGVIKQYAAATAPAGYLLCQGQTVSRTTYAALFQVIGTTYGAGDGSTTFHLPDLRTRVPVGLNSSGTFNALNNKGGAETHTITQAQLPNYTLSNTLSVNNTGSGHQHYLDVYTNTDGSHTHTASTTGYSYLGGGGNGGSFPPGTSFYLQSVSTTVNSTNSTHQHRIQQWTSSSSTSNQYGAHTHGLSGSVTSGGSGNSIPIIQPYIVLNYIIKY